MKVAVGNIFSQIIYSPNETNIYKMIQAKHIAMSPGYIYTKAYQRYRKTGKGWSGRIKMIKNDGVFLTGLLPGIKEMIYQAGAELVIEDRRVLSSPKLLSSVIEVREYQKQAVKSALQNQFLGTWWPRGVIEIATGGGKTRVAADMIRRVNTRTMFFVHRKDLLYQTISHFDDLGIKAGIIGDGKFEPDFITVSTIQTVNQRASKGDSELIDILKSTRQVFFDEAHSLAASYAKGNIFVSTAAYLENAGLRWGLTATPFKRDSYSNWLLEGVCGPSLFTLKNADLINSGYLSKPTLKIVTPPEISLPGAWPDDYTEGIVFNTSRNDIINKIASKAQSPMLIFVNKIAHGETLYKILKKQFPVKFVQGRTSSEDRLQATNELRHGKINAVIATTVWNEGIDIPELRTVILAGGGKSIIQNLQKMGRGLRITDTKNEVTVWDFDDRSSKWLRTHSRDRIRCWINEGFVIENVNI